MKIYTKDPGSNKKAVLQTKSTNRLEGWVLTISNSKDQKHVLLINVHVMYVFSNQV